jgi:hypothetical protein
MHTRYTIASPTVVARGKAPSSAPTLDARDRRTDADAWSYGYAVEPAAQADQRAGGPEDVPDPVQQLTPAAQRPGVGQLRDRLFHQRARSPACTRLNARCPSVSWSRVLRSPTGACQCSRVLASPRNPRSSRLTTSTSSSTPPSPASSMSSCSWQLPGQPPSHHNGSPWMVDRPHPGRCGGAAWRRTAPSGWPTRGHQPVQQHRGDRVQRTSSHSGGVPPVPGGRDGSRWARRAASQASTSAGSDERGQHDTGSDLLAGVRHLAHGLVPSMSGRTKHHGHPD